MPVCTSFWTKFEDCASLPSMTNLAHPKFSYTKGLHALGTDAYAWLQPDGGWGWSNSGLIVDGDQSLVVDTLFDVPLTREMLVAYADAAPAAQHVNKIVNTHHNGDHCNGNCCCPDADIIAHRLTLESMREEPPSLVQGFLDAAPELGELGRYITHCFGPFDFKSVSQKLPEIIFEDSLSVHVGARRVDLKHVGPAHTPGDTIVYVPDARILYTGDILFIEGHPIVWPSSHTLTPVANWLSACDYIMGLDVEAVVPGHGPITDKRGVAAVRNYLMMLHSEARKRYDAGMSYYEAACDIALDTYNDWGDRERVVINCATLYREYGLEETLDIATLFGAMAQYRQQHL